MSASTLPSRTIRTQIRQDLAAIHHDYDLQQYLERDNDPTPIGFRRNREKAMLSCIQNGDVERIENYLIPAVESAGRGTTLHPNELSAIWDQFSVGHLSEEPLKQMLYLFISSITLCTRAAVDGGLPESQAYALSDSYIRYGAQLTDLKRLAALSSYAAYDFTRTVADYRFRNCSPVTRTCCAYIQKHLHDRISLQDLSAACHKSPHYISDLFAKELGHRPVAYIRKRKLEYALGILEISEITVEAISDLLAFPSTSSFIACFKKAYGCTPGQWRQRSTEA